MESVKRHDKLLASLSLLLARSLRSLCSFALAKQEKKDLQYFFYFVQ